MKSPKEMAREYANEHSGNCCQNDFPGLLDAWLAGYEMAMRQGAAVIEQTASLVRVGREVQE